MVTESVWTLHYGGNVAVFSLPRFDAIGLAARTARRQGATVTLHDRQTGEEIRVLMSGITTVLAPQEN